MAVAAPPESLLGNYYRVDAVLAARFYGRSNVWIPVIGPKHTDAEHIEFPWPHWHIDWRFAPSWLWSLVQPYQRFDRESGKLVYTPNRYYGVPIQCPDTHGNKVAVRGPEKRRMKMKRELGDYPTRLAKWLPSLQEELRARNCAALVDGRCPHRGIPVSAMKRDGDIFTCPGHGLRWNAITGELVA